MQRFWDKVDRSGDCWLWAAKGRRGPYGTFRMRVGGIWRQCSVHRVAWELMHGPIPQGQCVLHSCDTPLCVRHLFLGTNMDNTQDMISKGRMVILKGEARGHVKLTENGVRNIRQMATEGVPRENIAQQFEVHVSVINKAVRRETWAHVE